MKKLAAITLIFAAFTASASLAQQVPATPKPSQTTETFGAWTVRCVGAEEAQCEAVQIINGKAGTIAEIAIALPAGQKEAILASRAPLGVMISEPIRFGEKDAADAFAINYVTCVNKGCLAQAKVPTDGLLSLADKKAASLTIKEHSGRTFQILVSLDGLKDALTRLGGV